MTPRADFAKIELQLIRVLHTLITERSVSRAAMKLASTQPAVSAQLKRLRALTGDPLLVRAGNGMMPTDAALALVEPATRLLQDAERLFGARVRERGFVPQETRQVFRIAASDYLDPLFLPELVARVQREAPLARLEARLDRGVVPPPETAPAVVETEAVATGTERRSSPAVKWMSCVSAGSTRSTAASGTARRAPSRSRNNRAGIIGSAAASPTGSAATVSRAKCSPAAAAIPAPSSSSIGSPLSGKVCPA